MTEQTNDVEGFIAEARDLASALEDREFARKPATLKQTGDAHTAILALIRLIDDGVLISPAEAGGIDEDGDALHFEPSMETLVADIHKFLLEAIQQAQKPWAQMDETEQNWEIIRVGNYARRVVTEAVVMAALGDKPSIAARCKSFAVADEVKVLLTAVGSDENLIALNRFRGEPVRVVSVSIADMMEGEEPEAQADQPEMPLDDKPDSEEDDGAVQADGDAE